MFLSILGKMDLRKLEFCAVLNQDNTLDSFFRTPPPMSCFAVASTHVQAQAIETGQLEYANSRMEPRKKSEIAMTIFTAERQR